MHPELTSQQYQAIELLAAGCKLGNIAETLGIERQTLWRWRQLPQFQHAQHTRCDFLRDEMRESVMHLLQHSLATLAETLTTGMHSERRDTSLQVLRLLQPACLSIVAAAPAPATPSTSLPPA